jgi:hypothetical protein
VLFVSTLGAPGVTPDSVTYLAAAHGLLAGHGYVAVDGQPFVEFPPLYPTLVAVTTLGFIPAGQAARVIVALSFGVIVAVTGMLVQQGTASRRYAVVGAGAALVMPALLDVSLHIWSEPPFIAWVMLSLLAMVRYRRAPSTRNLLAVAALAALAALTRYIGVTIAASALLLVLGTQRRSLRRLSAHALLLTAVALGPLALWLLRNHALTGTFVGERYPATASLADVAMAAADTFTGWFLPAALPMKVRFAALVAGGIGVIALVASAVPSTILLFIATYTTALVITATRIAADPIDDRLLSPLAPPVIVLLLLATHAAVARWRRLPAGTAVRVAVPVLVVGWLLVAAVASTRLARPHMDGNVAGYEAARWRQSALIRYLQQGGLSGPLYSNDPFAIGYLAGTRATLSPRRHAYQAPGSRVEDLPRLMNVLAASQPVYLVWFDDVPRDFLLSPEELATLVTLEPLMSVADGTVYRMTERMHR